MESNFDENASKNFEYVRSLHDGDIEKENLSEARIYDYFNLASSILLGVSMFEIKPGTDEIEKVLLVLYIISFSLVILIGFIGRLKIYRFWKEIKKYDLEDSKNWNIAENDIYGTKDVNEKQRIFKDAKKTESSIGKLKPDGNTDPFIYLQAFFTFLGLTFMVILTIMKVW